MTTVNELATTRHNALIDPGMHVWHGEVAAYLFLGGLVAGVMVLTGLWLLLRPTERRSKHLSLLPWSAPVLLSVGMFFLWLDLENPWNAYRFYLVFRPASPMSWGAWILLAIYPASLALAWATTPEVMKDATQTWLQERWPRGSEWFASLARWLGERVRLVAAANVVGGVGLGIYTGMLLGTMAARPLWNSAILGPLFLMSGLSTGAAYMLLYRLEARERVLLAWADVGLIVAEIGLIAIWLIGLASGGEATRTAGAVLMGGPYTAAFWVLVAGLGLLAPLASEWMELRRGHVPGRLAAVLVLLGGFTLRWIIVYAGQHAGWESAAIVMLP